jgi:hypothetical protein
MADYPRIPIFSMQVGQYPYVLVYLYRRLLRKKRTFIYDGRAVEYFEHPYNRTWLNERAVEVPIIWDLMQKQVPEDVLEIGNVISHYYQFGHTVVDKYEKGRGTIQQDVVNLALPKRYPLIVTISTIEHVGWDETPRTPDKHRQAMDSLKRHLVPGGLLVVTLPIGYNPDLDRDLFAGSLGFEEIHYFKRLTKENWKQVNSNDVRDAKYGVPFRAANALVVGFLRK